MKRRKIDNKKLRQAALYFIGMIVLNALEQGNPWPYDYCECHGGTETDSEALIRMIRRQTERLIDRSDMEKAASGTPAAERRG